MSEKRRKTSLDNQHLLPFPGNPLLLGKPLLWLMPCPTLLPVLTIQTVYMHISSLHLSFWLLSKVGGWRRCNSSMRRMTDKGVRGKSFWWVSGWETGICFSGSAIVIGRNKAVLENAVMDLKPLWESLTIYEVFTRSHGNSSAWLTCGAFHLSQWCRKRRWKVSCSHRENRVRVVLQEGRGGNKVSFYLVRPKFFCGI